MRLVDVMTLILIKVTTIVPSMDQPACQFKAKDLFGSTGETC